MDVLASTPLHHCQVQILSTKMEAALLELLQQAKEAGTKASLSFTMSAARWEAKFKVELVSTGPATASPNPTATTTAPGGGRLQPFSAFAVILVKFSGPKSFIFFV